MATRLQSSFAALYALLEKRSIARRVVVFLLVIHTILLAYSAYVHSPTLNEPGHLVAGLSYWKFGRFDVYNVNPPLPRMVAALPVMAVGYEEDWSGFYEGPGARPEMRMGEAFVNANGERSFFLFMIARWACIPFSWIGAIVCYLWARDLYSRPAGVLACTIWCFEPTILAHASLITPDVEGTALGLAACYTFWRWLKNPTWIQAALTGAVLGLAELAKTTLILFYPLWPLMWLIYRRPDRHRMAARDWLREAGMLALRMGIGLYVLNLGYGFEGSFMQLKEFHFVSDLFMHKNQVANGEHAASNSQHPTQHNRFAHTWLGELPVPFPKNYLLGIDVQQRDFESYGRPSYLRGEWHDRGWWYYYLYAVSIKIPIGLWAIGLLTLVVRLLGKIPPFGKRLCMEIPMIAHRDTFVLLLPSLVIFTAVSSKTGFSEHMRYILPSLPFTFIWLAQTVQVFHWSPRYSRRFQAKVVASTADWGYNYGSPAPLLLHSVAERRIACIAAIFATGFASWFVASSLWIYPHSLSYFNELVRGPLNGPKHLLSSNVDWGQDLRYLKRDLENKFDDSPIWIAYFGSYDPSNVGLECEGPLPDVPSAEELEDMAGLYAVSTNFVFGYPWHAIGSGRTRSFDRNALSGFQRLVWSGSAGYSIRIYQVTAKTTH